MYRRSFVAGLGALWLPSLARAEAPLAQNPFGLGIASGHPTPQSVVLWTRLLATSPIEPLTGTFTVDWTIAEDERLQRVVRRGQATAEPRWGHSIHVEVDGLKPGRPYWYRFVVNGKESPIGRTLTAPESNERVPLLRFAFASCQQYEQGYYAALRHMAGEELNAVLFLGDYIYEISWGRNHVRQHGAGRPTLLFEYRNRYALYKSDPDLQAAHASHPWIVTWDDHEVVNDYANDLSPTDSDPKQFLAIRAAAYQAYWEHMPLPLSMQPKGSSLKLYDRYRFGDLAELFVVDDRQYRAHNACHAELTRDRLLVDCAERLDPTRTMLGAAQEAWFADSMKRASGRWNLIAQQTLMAEAGRLTKDDKRAFWGDGWDGYPAARRKLLDAVAASPTKNTVVMSGDVHSFWATDLKQDFASPASRTVATEFVGGSVTSQGFTNERIKPLLRDNPHLRYGAGEVYGYGHIALDAKAATVSFRTVDDVRDPKSGIKTLTRFAVEAGDPGVKHA